MSLVGRSFGPRCGKCGRQERTVFGSAQWHSENDPPEGYCACDIAGVGAPQRADVNVTCSACDGRKVLGIPGGPCPVCRGTGRDEVATAANVGVEKALIEEILENERTLLDLVIAGKLEPSLAKACQEGFGRCAMKVAARMLVDRRASVRVTESALKSMDRVACCTGEDSQEPKVVRR